MRIKQHYEDIHFSLSRFTDVKTDFKEKAIKLMSPGSDVKQSVNVEGNNVSITYHIPGKTIEAKTSLGEPVNMPFFDGRIMQVT